MADYDFKEVEKKIKKMWEDEGIFRFDMNKKGKIFSIDTPPPTVSGKMHIGHACSYSQQDFIARYHRMKGENVFYPFGTDDNGLPTERLVEKTKKVRSREMPREKFIKLCMDFLKEELPGFIQDWKDIGISCDWKLSYSTIDKHSRRISQWSFLDLYKKKRLYRKDAPAMWCPECKTGVAQVEVQDKEIDSMFNDIVFRVGKEELIIATTRPELLPACVSIFYHPKDERYRKYKGKMAKVPLFDFQVPIMEDERADPEKGTGIVMCCTFGDQTDMEWQKAHNLPIKIAISHDGKITDIGGKYKGLSIKEARKQIINDLKEKGLLKNQKPIKHFVNVHERCSTEIEFVKSKQWFVKYLDLRDKMLKWGEELKWHPDHMKVRYFNWVKGLQWDWLISNQRYFGVSFPVWYCKKCDEVIVADEKDLPVDPMAIKPHVKECPKCKSKEFIPETDVLNTWFTSSMTPQIATWLLNEKDRKKVFPMSLRPQAHEIITFWLFNTMVKSRLHFDKNPWSNAMISGFVTLQGEKMSKSKGNVIEPQSVIEKYGADALRFWASSSKLGEDFDYQEKDLVAGKKFETKLWNASNFVFMNLSDYKYKKPTKLEKIDSLFLDKLNSLIKSATEAFDNYEYSKAKLELEKFFWSMFCDNYLEIVKRRIYENKPGKESAQYVLYSGLLNILKMIAPIMPFITEEIYQMHFRKQEKDKSIHISEWPKMASSLGKTKETGRNADKSVNSFDEFDLFVEILTKIRQEKTNNKKSMKSEIILYLDKESMKKIKDILEDLKDVSNAKEIKEGKEFRVEFV